MRAPDLLQVFHPRALRFRPSGSKQHGATFLPESAGTLGITDKTRARAICQLSDKILHMVEKPSWLACGFRLKDGKGSCSAAKLGPINLRLSRSNVCKLFCGFSYVDSAEVWDLRKSEGGRLSRLPELQPFELSKAQRVLYANPANLRSWTFSEWFRLLVWFAT